LDLFAGSGAIGLEALSRGAAKATFVEADRKALACIKDNIVKLGVGEKAELMQGDVFQILTSLIAGGRYFDLIYADPPYKNRVETEEGPLLFNHALLKVIDKEPLLNTDGQLFLEDAILDQKEHMDVDKQLTRLYLKSIRRFGDSQLRQYLFKPN
jgi:16S rRNA (guanine966-N2)-methyltransferase